MDTVAEFGYAPRVEAELPQLLTALDLAKQLDSISRHRLYELARADQIPHVRIGRSYRFSKRAIIAWVEAGGTSAASENG